MTTISPIPAQWDGETFRPLPNFSRMADRQFVIGETYRLAPIEERSDATHDHQFAWLKSAWESLPEALTDVYPTPKHLRKRALIAGGYCTETLIDAGSQAAALRVAAYAKGEDAFAWVVTRGPIVVVRKAKSQSLRAMGKAEFQASKTAILDWVSDLLGVEPETLARAA